MFRIIDLVMRTCGVSLQEILKGRRFATLVKREKRISALKANSDEGIAYQTGHLVMGTLLNSLPEQQALEQARKNSDISLPSIEERALIHLCGELIVSTAEGCLTENIRQMAERWKKSTAEEQILIARDLFFEFRTEGQNADGALSMNLLRDKITASAREREYEKMAYLPGLYGVWNKKNNPANCQGKTQMLVAFAKLAGARAVVVHPIQHARDYPRDKRREVKREVELDLIARGLDAGSKEFAESLRTSHLDDQMRDKNSETFHVGVALRLRDGRWVMIDPHGLSWGLVQKDWGMTQATRVLRKYREVLPGLTVIAGNSETGKGMIDDLITCAKDLLERSRKMEERIKERVYSLMDLVNVVCESDDFDLLMRLNSEQEGKEALDLSNPEYRKYAAMIIVIGGQEVMFDFQKMLDPEFLKEKIRIWLTFYHACAMNLFLNRETDKGLLVHPVCEVSASVEWAIAISAINSARFDYRTEHGGEREAFFIRNSFDQTSLFNAVGLYSGPIGLAAQKTLQSLPYLHPMCARKLRGIERISNAW